MDGKRRVMVAAPLIAGLLACTGLAWFDSAPAETNPYLQMQTALRLAASASSDPDEQGAVVSAVRAVRLQPGSPYAWAALAEVRYLVGVADETFELALRRAVELGVNEPVVQATVAFYGFAVWDEVGAPTRTAVERVVTAGIRRDAAEVMRIAKRRGRLDVACRHVGEASAIPDNWAQLCKSTEAK